MISLTDLKSKRAAMTQGEWNEAADGVHLWQVSPANAAGIVATHNAADVLIAVAEAALDRAYAECSCGAELGCFPDCTREIAGQRLLAALAKITP